MPISEHRCHFRLDSASFARSLEVVTFQGSEAINKPFSFDVHAISYHGELALQQCIFSDAYLTSKWPGVGFHAQIQGIGRSNTGSGAVHYHITLGPRMGCLAHRYNQRIFQDMPASAIIGKVLNEHGIRETDYAFQLTRRHEAIEFCAQHGETDLQLLDRLCAQEGIHYYFEHSSVRHVLIFTDDLRHTRRTSRVQFAQQFKRGEISQFEVRRASGRGAAEPGTLRAKGASGLHFLHAGMQLPMAEHPDPHCNQSWLLTEVHHRGLRPASRQGVPAPAYCNRFSGVQATFGLRRANARSATRRIGLQRARVVGELFEEAQRDHEGRIKVRFDWGHQGDGSRYTDCWLPIEPELEHAATPWWGGMEVVVDFVDGDPDQPEIIDHIWDPDISPLEAGPNTRGAVQTPPASPKRITTRLDRHQVLGDAQQIRVNELTLHLDSSNELDFSVGSSQVIITRDSVRLSSPNIVMAAHDTTDDENGLS
jgi:type VI secretion system secreted protein VgrG